VKETRRRLHQVLKRRLKRMVSVGLITQDFATWRTHFSLSWNLTKLKDGIRRLEEILERGGEF